MLTYKEAIQRNFSRNAEHYSDYSMVRNTSAMFLVSLLDGIDPATILEAGCGTGLYTKMLRSNFPDSQITAVDISEQMLRVASRNVGTEKMDYVCGDIEDMPVTSGEYDLITSNATIQWFEDIASWFNTCNNALVENGQICFAIYGPNTFREFGDVIYQHTGKNKVLSSSNFKDSDHIIGEVCKHFEDVEFFEKEYTETFASLVEMIKYIRLSGTRGLGGTDKIYLGKDILMKMEKTYLDIFNKIVATHSIYYVKAKRKER